MEPLAGTVSKIVAKIDRQASLDPKPDVQGSLTSIQYLLRLEIPHVSKKQKHVHRQELDLTIR